MAFGSIPVQGLRENWDGCLRTRQCIVMLIYSGITKEELIYCLIILHIVVVNSNHSSYGLEYVSAIAQTIFSGAFPDLFTPGKVVSTRRVKTDPLSGYTS